VDQTKKEFNVRLYQSGDEAPIVQLLNNVFKPWPRFELECSLVDHWKWKFVDNPANKRANANDTLPHAVAVNKEEIIGIIHGMLYYTKVGENTYLSQKGADVAVNDNYHGMGIFSKIDKQKENTMNKLNCFFGYSLTSNPVILGSTNADSFVPFPHPIKYLIKIKDVEEFFKHMKLEESKWNRNTLKAAVYGAKLLNKLTNINLTSAQTKIELKQITMFDDSIDRFYDKIKPYYSFIVEKTANYMNWRYCDKRGGDFKTWTAGENGEVEGFIVLRVNQIDPANHVGYIMDLLALDGRLDVAEILVSFASDWFNGLGVNVVHAQIVEGHIYESLYNKYGFLDSQAKPYLRYRPRASVDDLEKFNKAPPSALHYPYGEGDAI
jgi:hypothetical protein